MVIVTSLSCALFGTFCTHVYKTSCDSVLSCKSPRVNNKLKTVSSIQVNRG